MGRLNSILCYMGRHKYPIIFILFGVLIGFVDENSLWKRFQNRRQIASMHSEIKRYDSMIKEDTKKLNKLAANPIYMEDIAREQYFLKKPNEDIFIFEDSDSISNETVE
jgi:cell division protein DivIC